MACSDQNQTHSGVKHGQVRISHQAAATLGRSI